MVTKEQIEEVLRTVFDPEIPVNIIDLGLVYEINIKNEGEVAVTMTLTAPACPVAGDIIFSVEQKVREIEGVKDVYVHLTFDPPWNREMMTDEARYELGWL